MNSTSVMSFIAVMLFVGFAPTHTDALCKRHYCRYELAECMADNAPMQRWSLAGLQGCLWKASGIPDDLVLQWNRHTGECSVFHYQQVCRAMLARGARVVDTDQLVSRDFEQASKCSVYRAKALATCNATLSPKLIGTWLAGGSNHFSNLVCQDASSPNYRLVSENLQWTDEGAVFDGVSSYALVNDSRFYNNNPSAGFTWLLRLRRRPKVQPFMEAVPCSDMNYFGAHLWEFNAANRLYFFRYSAAASGQVHQKYLQVYSPVNILASSENEWLNIGASVVADSNNTNIFYNARNVNETTWENTGSNYHPCYLVYIGRRPKSSSYLRGVVQAVAIANDTMTEQEIRDFYAALP